MGNVVALGKVEQGRGRVVEAGPSLCAPSQWQARLLPSVSVVILE